MLLYQDLFWGDSNAVLLSEHLEQITNFLFIENVDQSGKLF